MVDPRCFSVKHSSPAKEYGGTGMTRLRQHPCPILKGAPLQRDGVNAKRILSGESI